MDHATAAAIRVKLEGEQDMAAVELWEWEQDAQAMDVQLHGNTGSLIVTTRDRDGDVTVVELPWRAARAMGVALVNGTAPWAAVR